jgi:hypothetical protein
MNAPTHEPHAARHQPWVARWLSLLAVVGAATAAVTCGGDVRVDDDSAAGGGSSGGQGGAAQQGPGPSSVGPGTTGPSSVGPGTTGPVTTVGPGPVSSSSGGGDCLTCGVYISDCIFSDVPSDKCFETPWCRESLALFEELVGCVCSVCQMECVNTCAGSGGDDPEVCGDCQIESIQGGACGGPFNACANDV